MTSLSVAQGHINGKILEILEANDVKPSRRREKSHWFAHTFLSIIEQKKQFIVDLIQENHSEKREVSP